MRLRTQRRRKVEAYHWDILANRILAGDMIQGADLESVAVNYAANEAVAIILDPLVEPGAMPIRHTPDGTETLFRNLIAFTEVCVRMQEMIRGIQHGS